MPDVFLVRWLLNRQLLKAYPNTNKDPGRNALLATYCCSQPLQQASTRGLFSERLGWLWRPTSWGGFPSLSLSSLIHPQHDGGLLLSPLTSGRERHSWREVSRCGGLGTGWLGLTPAVHPLHPACPPHRPRRVRGSLLCASRILPGRCQSPECGQRPCWWIPQMERGNRPNRPQPQAIS